MKKNFFTSWFLFVLFELICCHSATLWYTREKHWPVQSACLPAGLKHKPRLRRSLRRGDWHSGGRGLSASCTGHYSRRITWGCLDPHCQHINLSVSWIHQGHHRAADAVMDNCCASFLCRFFFFFFHFTGAGPDPSVQLFYQILCPMFQPRWTQQNGGPSFWLIGMFFFAQ